MPGPLKFILCLALPLMVGGISGFITAQEISGWYVVLQKPSFNPPNWIFGPVWTALYLAMGVSLFMVINEKKDNKKIAILIFVLQLALNFFWSIIFFNLHQIGLALLDIVLLWLCISAMIISFYRINKISGLLQIPYLLWVTFATVLNASIWVLNQRS